MKRDVYGQTENGQEVLQFTLQNSAGMTVKCINYGCRITNIWVPAASGEVADVVLGYGSLAEYERDGLFLGAFIGRYANRIKGAQFQLEGKTCHVTQNDGENYLHGSYHSRVFTPHVLEENSVRFSYTSPDGEDGFPGEVEVSVTYTLTDKNEWIMDYKATPASATHINLTNHSYFNLGGDGEPVTEHMLWMNSTSFLEAGEGLCPTGRMVDSTGGAFDFTREKPIGQDIGKEDPQLLAAGGYDHCFVLNKQQEEGLAMAASATYGGRTLRVYTTQPAVQLYMGNFLQGDVMGKGAPMVKNSGFCLETQHYPCSPNYPAFPTTLVQPGETYHEVTTLHFQW